MQTTDGNKKKGSLGFWLSLLRFLILPAIGVILLQCLSAYQQNFDESVYYNGSWFTGLGIRFIWNYLILLIPYAVLYFLPFFRFTSLALHCVVTIFGLAEHYVILFRNTIIYPWDLENLGLAASVGSTYQYVISKEVVIALILFAVMCGLSFVGRDPRLPVITRASVIAVILVASGLYIGLFVTNKSSQLKANIRFYYTLVNYNYENGVLMNFCYHFRFLIHTPPSGYNLADEKAALEQYDTSVNSVVPDGQKPDVIMIMSEAFSDLRVISDFKTNEPAMPYWDSLSGNNVIKKTLLTSAFGGNTANSEFEVLTGMSMQFISSGTYPYKHYIRNSVTSIASILKDNGYDTISFHPFEASGWNRNKVMPLLGFDSFVGEEAFTGTTNYRGYVSDMSAYDYVISQYEKHKSESPDTPLMEYLITIQNHGGYAAVESLPYSIVPDSYDAYPQANQYLSLLHLSDDALQKLITYFSSVDHPTVIILYGDHQPNLADGFQDYLHKKSDDNSGLNRYETKLLVWANYDISKSELAQMEGDAISTNYVSTYLSDILGVQRTPFQGFLKEMHTEISLMDENYIVDKDGNVYSADSANLPASMQSWLNKYKLFQYYQLYDETKNR